MKRDPGCGSRGIQDPEHARDVNEQLEPGERLRFQAQLLDAVGQAIIATDLRGTVLYWNRRAEQLYGWSTRQVTGRGLHEFLVSEDPWEKVGEIMAQVGEGRSWSGEFVVRRKDGTSVPVQTTYTPVRDAGGRVVGIIGISTDITERKSAEAKLVESERRFATLLSTTPAMVYRCLNEPDWPEEYVSDYALELTGYPAAAFMETPTLFGSLISEEDRQRIWDEVQEAVGRGERFRLHYAISHKDGGLRFVEELGQGVYDESGSVVALEGLIYDVTERVRVEEALKEAETRYRTLVEQIPAVTYIDRADGSDEPLYTSPQIEQMLGYTPQEWLERRLWPERLHPDDKERVLAADERFESGGESFMEEYRLIAKDGSVVWVREEAMLVRGKGGEPLYWQGVMYDITERMEAEARLRESEERFRALTQNSSDIVTLLEVDGTILYESPSIERILGYEPQELEGENAFGYVHPDDLERVLGAFAEGLSDSALRPTVEYRFRHKDGSWRWLESIGTNMLDDPAVGEIVVNSRDVSERKAAEERLAHQALHDPLTDLPNRVLFTDRLRQALARAKRRSGEVAVLFMDLDNLKVINDSLGHEAGDRLLVTASKRIRSLLRPEDTVGRLGGDEFVLLLEDTDSDGAARVAQRILEKLRVPFSLGGRQLSVTASVGITVGDGNRKRAADLLRDADSAMYRAKHAGKARYAVFDETMNTRALERLELEHDLRRAVERNEFVVHYQPKVSLATGKIVGFEALARWEHPERGLLLPERFVPLAEETGLIIPIGEAVLEAACRQANEWHERKPFDPPAMCVNLWARQFKEPGLTESVARILDETGLEPSSLFLEVSESTAMRDVLTTSVVLERLQNLGVRTILDDFGTGYSSLSYLERFPLDYIKIDRSFVGGLGEYPGAQVLVSAIISLAHALGLEVVAEGVETEEHFERLRGMGCDLAQGYLFSQPLIAKEAADVLGAVYCRNLLGAAEEGGVLPEAPRLSTRARR
ncbi:MAG: PAS domain S-box protein [Actinomycetota bacterium]|nr:PAS domain S-box protein [Actinomycetota bacterium]